MKKTQKQVFKEIREDHSVLAKEFRDHLVDYAGFKGKLYGLAIGGSVIMSIITSVIIDKLKG